MITFSRLPQEKNKHEEKNNKKQSIYERYIIGNLSKIHYVPPCSLSIFASIKERIPKTPLNINDNTSPISLIGTICGSMNIIPNQPAAKFTKSSDNIENHALSSLTIFLYYFNKNIYASI